MIKNSKEEKTGSVIDDLLNEIPEKKMKKVAACMRLAARIADLMAGAGYSKSSFAALLGKEPSVITKWLSGTHNFTYETLLDITMALDVEMAALHEEKKPEVVEVAHVAITGVRSWYSPVANELHEIGYQRNHRNYGFYGEPGKVQINPFPAKVEQKPEFVMVENSHHQISYSQGSIKKKSTIRRKNSPIQGSYE
jgi:transcriptional regulator with XRE-family HTH domain